ncbi:hypothetical protein CEP52_006142 [Fusarium oligoseptatum]|uniref:Uncharacterized protein n=1 Tax=Fusarium oligoseptatum TaxID=2604345 RepID=A0A428TUA5_9HYPO|nr:hypothetical protein CEP52_006142 [Fusarium oligoseptatum]
MYCAQARIKKRGRGIKTIKRIQGLFAAQCHVRFQLLDTVAKIPQQSHHVTSRHPQTRSAPPTVITNSLTTFLDALALDRPQLSSSLRPNV